MLVVLSMFMCEPLWEVHILATKFFFFWSENWRNGFFLNKIFLKRKHFLPKLGLPVEVSMAWCSLRSFAPFGQGGLLLRDHYAHWISLLDA